MRTAYRAVRLAGLVWLAAGIVGCNQGQSKGFTSFIELPKSPQEYMLVAVSDPDPDLRRQAVGKIARGGAAKSEWAFEGLSAIALLDSDSQARGVALRALAQGRDPRAADVFLKILNHTGHPADQVRPPTDTVRWEACAGLADFAVAGLIPDAPRPQVRSTFLTALEKDTERHVRMAAARGLGAFADREVLEKLVATLKSEDFGVVYECESALIRLTGVTHQADALAWETWLKDNAGTEFAQAGSAMPPSRVPKYERGNWISESTHRSNELFKWLFPGRKPK